MTTRDAGTLVRRMQECFNTRQFDQAEELFTSDFFSHPLGKTGFETGTWRTLVARFPDFRVVAEDVLVDGDKVVIRSSVEGVPIQDGGDQPMLIEIFRVADGRLAEMWGVVQGLSLEILRADAAAG